MKRERILKIVFTVWIILWIFFLVREDKDGQYRALGYLYTHGPEERVRFITGDKLYDFLIFCRENIPPDSTYELDGFEELSIDEVRARYFLWPLKSVPENADFKVIYGEKKVKVPGYKEYERHGTTGRLLTKEDRNR